MATYVISDIHGDYDSYIRMLELIEFSDNDELYVLGDVIDRYPNGVEILLDIMERPNIHMILGNHEDMCYRGVVLKDRDSWSMWIRNGGGVTRKGLFYKETAKHRNRIMTFLRRLPTFLEIKVGGNRFHLVHAGPSEYEHERLWFRIEEKEPELIPCITVIVGHTPTPYLSGDPDGPGAILHGDGIIFIDCGCGSDNKNRRLGCLRLDDMKEFYITCED